MEEFNQDIAVFDLCGTLYKSNTTFDFLKFYFFKKKRYVPLLLLSILQTRFIKIFVVLFSFNAKVLIVKMLKGESVSEVEKYAKLFFDSYLSKKINSPVFDIFLEKLEQNSRVVIASASICPVVNVVSNNFKLTHICSSLEIEDGVYTGYYEADLEGLKSSFFVRGVAFFATDNLTDINLIEKSENFLVVTKKKNIRKWCSLLNSRSILFNEKDFIVVDA